MTRHISAIIFLNIPATFYKLEQTDANVRQGRSDGKPEHQEEDNEWCSLKKSVIIGNSFLSNFKILIYLSLLFRSPQHFWSKT